jgi:hypothetical protein
MSESAKRIKRIDLTTGSPARPPRALLGYASLEDTYQINGIWYGVSDWRSWMHRQSVLAYRHAGVEDAGLRVGEHVGFYAPTGTFVGAAQVTTIQMINARELTKGELTALDYDSEGYREIAQFENDAGWYVALAASN